MRNRNTLNVVIDWAAKKRRQSKRLLNKKRIKGRRSQHANAKKMRQEAASTDVDGGGGSREASCEKNECLLDEGCCICPNESCSSASGTSQTSGTAKQNDFLHISHGEHICRSCCDDISRVGRRLYRRFIEWKRQWLEESRCPTTVRTFVLDQLLPIWLRCVECGKFRPVKRELWEKMGADAVGSFVCRELNGTCTIPESKRVADAGSSDWIRTLSAPPLLHDSPAIHYLKEEYYYDEIGVSPTHASFEWGKGGEYINPRPPHFLLPFNLPCEPPVAFSLRPDVAEYDELKAFPEFAGEPVLYLAMRNLVVSLWSLNPFEHLTYETCFRHLVCAGLARVWYSTQLGRVIDYLTVKGVINVGVLPNQLSVPLRRLIAPVDIIVVGAGLSGLGAARQLASFGANVTVLEARSKIGGRMQDDWSLGVCVGCGAQLITGITNNPIVLMLRQIGENYRELTEECPLLDSLTGRIVPQSADRLVDEHFNCVLDCLGEWKRRIDRGTQDSALLGQFFFHHSISWTCL